MKFTYTYRSSDGQRHTAEIEAESRDAAFARVRSELGVKPIKVVLAEHGSAISTGRNPASRTVAYVLSVALVLLTAGGVWWMLRTGNDAPYQVMTPQGPVTYTVAQPLPRQTIPGDRTRIEEAMGMRTTAGREVSIAPQGASAQADNVQHARSAGVFKFAAEAYLARYAEPGRQSQMSRPQSLAEAFKTCLKEPIRIASTDFTEVVDLKRIVAGMKRETRAYLAGGGTVDGYLAELEKRQRLEASYRDSAERRLNEMLNAESSSTKATEDKLESQKPETGDPKLRAAYAYWLKANAQLQAMGIYPLALPDVLRTYQMTLDIEE